MDERAKSVNRDTKYEEKGLAAIGLGHGIWRIQQKNVSGKGGQRGQDSASKIDPEEYEMQSMNFFSGTWGLKRTDGTSAMALYGSE